MPKKQKSKNSGYVLALIKRLAPYKKQLIFVLILLLVAMVAGLSVPYINSMIVNNVLPKADMFLLVAFCMGILVLMLTESTIVFFQTRIMAKAGFEVAADIRQILFAKIQAQDLSFFQSYSKGDLQQRITGYVDEFAGFLSNYAIIFLINSFKLLVVLVFMFSLSWQLGLVVAAALVLEFLFLNWLKARLAKRGTVCKVYEGRRTSQVINNIKNSQLTLAYNRCEYNIKNYGKVVDEYTKQYTKYVALNELFVPGVESLWYWASVCIYMISYLLIGQTPSLLSIGVIIAFCGYITQMTSPLIQLGTVLQQIGAIEGACINVFGLIDRQNDIVESADPKYFYTFNDQIKFVSAQVKVKDTLPVKDVSFTVYKAQTVGIASSSSMTRGIIAGLFTRQHDVDKGQILIDGIDIKELKLSNLRNNIVVMDSEGYVFRTTAIENIRYADTLATDEQCQRAAKAAGIHDFIMAMPNGYETELPENGVGISDGQKQLFSFARILLHAPQVYVFNDIASTIGQITKESMIRTIVTDLSDKTVVVISTDEDFLAACDKVVFIEDGEVVAVGKHDTLLEMPEYKAMFKTED